VTDASKGTDGNGSGTAQANRGRRAADAGPGRLRARSDAVRSKVATVVWLVAVVCALFLAVGALLIALKANEDNSIVEFIISVAERLQGPFSRENGIFTFADDQDGQVKSALTNWGIAAVVYLVIGKILDRIIRP
jgi:predicted SpoU family rRNA methylase